MSSRARIALLVGAVVVLVAAFVVARGGGDNKTASHAATTPAPAATTGAAADTTAAAPAIPVVDVVGAKPQGGVQKLKFIKGQTIRFTVKSDTADEIHFHGYDVHKDVKAGGQLTFSVPATIEGRFVVELERHKTQIAEVEVDPS
jgi:hypothetical protein